MWAKTLMDRDEVTDLEDAYIWKEALVRECFAWGDNVGARNIHCALVHVSELAEPWEITYEKKHGRCRSCRGTRHLRQSGHRWRVED